MHIPIHSSLKPTNGGGGDSYYFMVDMNHLARVNNQKPRRVIRHKSTIKPTPFLN